MRHGMVEIAGRLVGDGQPAFVIAEIGINHNGSVELAKKMIDGAALAGCDAVKFQKRTPEKCVPVDQWYLERDTPWGIAFNDGERVIQLDRAQSMGLSPADRQRIAAEKMQPMMGALGNMGL